MHLGKKIERIRELKGMKQDTLAGLLGVSQQTVSRLEQSEKIDEERLVRIADVLGVSVEGIMKFNEDGTINIFSSSLHDSAGSYNNCPVFHFNPVEKIIELYETIIKQKDDMLKLKDEVIEMYKNNRQAS
ncbi:MAG: helix-turn-helix transcriptional regulator [Bacteroidetes bacterium]|nr:helix-turn-helix transcriptional regulator [Bacteroidota bacterium]